MIKINNVRPCIIKDKIDNSIHDSFINVLFNELIDMIEIVDSAPIL
jgi:hypothetical protein